MIPVDKSEKLLEVGPILIPGFLSGPFLWCRGAVFFGIGFRLLNIAVSLRTFREVSLFARLFSSSDTSLIGLGVAKATEFLTSLGFKYFCLEKV